MRLLPKLAWWGLGLQFVALLFFLIVFQQLYGLEHPMKEGFWLDTAEARLAQRWQGAGVIIFLAGTAMLVLACLRGSRPRS